MFELPLIITSKRTRTSRKLKYLYINRINKKYDSINGISKKQTGLPTPENSATDTSENEEIILERKRRIKRRWRSIVGESYSDLESDDEQPADDVDNEERKFYRKYKKPQLCFERWQCDAKGRTPIQRDRINYGKTDRLQRYSLKKMKTHVMEASRSNKMVFHAMIQGYQVYDPTYGRVNSFQLKHIETLTSLLHINVLKRKWELAYKCFALLIRIPGVDVRALWGLGERILVERQPRVSLDFLQWMSNVYSTKLPFSEDINYRMAPVFTKGSKVHTPKYTMTWLWECLIRYANGLEDLEIDDPRGSEKNLQMLMDRISEMVLSPPYMDDPEVWFIYALCHMVKADTLSQNFDLHLVGSARDIASNQVIQHIQNTKGCLQQCSQKGGFIYPKRYIEKQLAIFEARLSTKIDADDMDRGDDDDYVNEDSPPISEAGIYWENLDTQLIDSESSWSD